jgi:hypothetical protein
VSPVVSSDKEYQNPKLVVLYQNICSLRGEKKNRIESTVMLRVKACSCNMHHTTLAE